MTVRTLVAAVAAVMLSAAAATAQPLPYPPAPPSVAALRAQADALGREVRFCDDNHRMYKERFERDPLGNASAAAFATQWFTRMKTAQLRQDAVLRQIADLERVPRF